MKGCVDIEITKFCLNVGAVVSSKGIGFCTIVPIPISPFGPTVPVPAGVGYTWGGAVSPRCSAATPSLQGGAAKRARQPVRRQLHPAVRAALGHGQGDRPRRRAQGRAEGTQGPAHPRASGRQEPGAQGRRRDPADPREATADRIKKPSAGRWTVVARLGRRRSRVWPRPTGYPPRGQGQRAGPRAQALLSYRIATAAGQRVTFFENGARTYRRLGAARGTRGRIRFAPGAGRRGRRESCRDRARRRDDKNLVVARYSVARDPRPARPRGLRVRRRATRS